MHSVEMKASVRNAPNAQAGRSPALVVRSLTTGFTLTSTGICSLSNSAQVRWFNHRAFELWRRSLAAWGSNSLSVHSNSESALLIPGMVLQ